MTCADPSGAAWRITALLDGLAVQATVHDGALSQAAGDVVGPRPGRGRSSAWSRATLRR